MNIRRFCTALVVCSVIVAISSTAGAKETLVPGVATDAGMTIVPVVQHLNSSPNIDVQLKVFPDHDALYRALKEKKVDLGFLGAVKYVEAHYEFGAVPLVAEGPAVKAYLVVPPKSPITKVEGLKGKRIAFGYEDSTTTHLIPALLLSKHNVKEKDVVATFVGHQPEKLINEMLAGKFDAAAASELTVEQFKGSIRVLEESDPFPGPPIVARAGLPDSVAAEVRKMFVSYKATGQTRFAKGAVAVTDADYNRIRFLCKVLFGKMYQ